jgi:pyruvate,water dikinase
MGNNSKMNTKKKRATRVIKNLKERVKELNCVYKVEELLNDPEAAPDKTMQEIVEIIPAYWQFPDVCQARITLPDKRFQRPGFKETPWQQSAEIKAQDKIYGKISVSYIKEVPKTGKNFFLKEESKLLNTLAVRIGQFLSFKELKSMLPKWQEIQKSTIKKNKGEWKPILDMLQKSDKKLYIYISQKMLYYLCWRGVEKAKDLLRQITPGKKMNGEELNDEINRPSQKETISEILKSSDEVFALAAEHLNENLILTNIQKWLEEDRSRFLLRIIDNAKSSLSQIIDGITKFHHLEAEGVKLSPAIDKGLRVSLIRHFFSDHLEFINIARNYIEISDYYELVQRIIFPPESMGKLGGKSSGLFLTTKILKKEEKFSDLLKNLKVPKTWYITSDGIIGFLQYNNLEEVFEQKYKETDEIHLEYPNIIQIFKNSYFPMEIIKGLSIALDDFGEKPIIVRSSSLLEDRFGASFSGKYKSLFLANQGPKKERLEALLDAIAEVYASVFSPNPIEYRADRGLLDFHEEMGILLQEVVGTRIGKYFLPTFAGVAFSNNEFRWAARIRREDGLLRIVPGLGTRAVDRIPNDYPILISPGNPDLRVNLTPEEIAHYSPKMIDVINMETNSFESMEISELIKNFGNEIPGIEMVVSVFNDNHIQNPTSLFNIDFEKDRLLVTFESLFTRTPFLKQMRAILNILHEKMNTPVDIEFAHDGKDLYLLQCRPQSYSKDIIPSSIPKDTPADKIIFSANRYISNGFIPDITQIVYVDPAEYARAADFNVLKNIGRVVGKLNKILPKRQFILMGPGRWGSRGDIKMGVDVNYADINNTAALIEIARKKGNYTPDLSFGTHFFQDLVESSIRYLPLYPDEEAVVFNEQFLLSAENILDKILPEYYALEKYVRVIDVPKTTDGLILRILMNADLQEAVAVIANPTTPHLFHFEEREKQTPQKDDYWRWRLHMIERLAASLDAKRFGVKGFYLFGSTKNATATPSSDIDILVHFHGSDEQKIALTHWLEGWSLTLAEMNYLRTGYKSDGLLDVHFVTDDDVAQKKGWAVKIGAITDAARPLPLKL